MNLAQIRSEVLEIFHAQPKTRTDGAKNRTFRSSLHAVKTPLPAQDKSKETFGDSPNVSLDLSCAGNTATNELIGLFVPGTFSLDLSFPSRCVRRSKFGSVRLRSVQVHTYGCKRTDLKDGRRYTELFMTAGRKGLGPLRLRCALNVALRSVAVRYGSKTSAAAATHIVEICTLSVTLIFLQSHATNNCCIHLKIFPQLDQIINGTISESSRDNLTMMAEVTKS